MDRLDAVVLGAGVVGLAVGRALALAGRSVVVLEQHQDFGMETSGRNSEVIHAGIYYPEGSLKARLCVEGKKQLYQYCKERRIAHRQTGKLIVAVTPEEEVELQGYINSAWANGVDDLSIMSAAQVVAQEPAVNAVAGLFSPSTGIVDSHKLMFSYLADIEKQGGIVVYNSPVLGGRPTVNGMELDIGGAQPFTCECNTVVNAAGLTAPQMAARLEVDKRLLPNARYARGHYYSLIGKSPFNHLVYPVANNGWLGVHVTLDIGGQARFGPDVQWIDDIDYRFDNSHRSEFVQAIRRYYPGLDETRLQPGYTGIRPKIVDPGEAAADFIIQTENEQGINGLVNLMGIESPGLTSSMAIADEVVARI